MVHGGGGELAFYQTDVLKNFYGGGTHTVSSGGFDSRFVFYEFLRLRRYYCNFIQLEQKVLPLYFEPVLLVLIYIRHKVLAHTLASISVQQDSSMASNGYLQQEIKSKFSKGLVLYGLEHLRREWFLWFIVEYQLFIDF